MTKTKQVKKQGTKTVWINNGEQTTSEITQEQYRNIVDSASYFRRLGGSCYQERSYTCRGYNVIRDVLTTPDKTEKTVREFTFE